MAEVPKLLGGRYEVGELLGRGGMAEVHRGYDSRLGRQVAIKMLRSELARDNTFLTRFRREAQSAAGLNHASIVAVYDHGEDVAVEAGGAEVKVPYIVMEFVDGKTLREIVTERTTLPHTEALRITEGVLDALAYSHRNGIVHRDIKPANVMISGDGTIKVMDFGIARAMADANATMTQTQAVIGTAQYLSPEQAQGQPVDARSDLYSTGCMLFELLTGRPPFLGESPVSIAYQHVGEQPLPPSRLVDGISEDLDAVVLHSLAKPRDARYQSAGEFRSDLQAVRLDRPISDAARGSAAALAGAAAGAAAGVAAGAAATEALPAVGTEPTQAYSGMPLTPTDTPPGSGTDTLPAVEDEAPAKRNRTGLVVLAVVAVAALAALAFGLSSYFGEPEVPRVTVPNVVDDPVQTAVAKLSQAQLEAETVRQPSDTVPADTVISQNPAGGVEVDEGSTVRIFVSSGPTAVTVPDLRGLTESEARAQLTDLGLELGDVEEVDDPETEKGRIIDSNPAVGSSVAPGSRISVRVGSGEVAVPNVVGKSQNEAQRLLADANLKVETDFRQTNSVPEGRVVEQDPESGTVEIGGTVKIVVAQKAAPTVTPTTVTPTPTPTPTETESPSPEPSPSEDD
ncbi:Stk1 family PASTA domain-containing Ser/Thr kinase [Fodinibacter luteus]|uniref:non-specific serine/threonine protein kinase n=1 Tax=Fodinibacter luteus TaxID=552064 RepID=A0ABP8KF01_9MICO